MVETTSVHRITIKFPMLQPPSPLLEMASLRLPDSEEFDVDTRRRSNNGNVPSTTVSASPPATGTLLQMRNDLGDYLNNLIAEAITTNPRTSLDEHGGLLNASKTVNLSGAEQMPDRLYRHSMAMSAVYCVAYILVFVVGLIGNSFVIAVVYRSPRMRTVTNFFIVNLAVADVLVIVFCLPATLMSNIFVREYRNDRFHLLGEIIDEIIDEICNEPCLTYTVVQSRIGFRIESLFAALLRTNRLAGSLVYCTWEY